MAQVNPDAWKESPAWVKLNLYRYIMKNAGHDEKLRNKAFDELRVTFVDLVISQPVDFPLSRISRALRASNHEGSVMYVVACPPSGVEVPGGRYVVERKNKVCQYEMRIIVVKNEQLARYYLNQYNFQNDADNDSKLDFDAGFGVMYAPPNGFTAIKMDVKVESSLTFMSLPPDAQ